MTREQWLDIWSHNPRLKVDLEEKTICAVKPEATEAVKFLVIEFGFDRCSVFLVPQELQGHEERFGFADRSTLFVSFTDHVLAWSEVDRRDVKDPKTYESRGTVIVRQQWMAPWSELSRYVVHQYLTPKP